MSSTGFFKIQFLLVRTNLEAFLGLPLFNSLDLFPGGVDNSFLCVGQDDPVPWDSTTTLLLGRGQRVRKRTLYSIQAGPREKRDLERKR
jgi:hypothetical protein